MADYDALRHYWAEPPSTPGGAAQLFGQAGIPAIDNHNGTNIGWPLGAEHDRWDTFEARASDIWLTSLPRCGTTWTAEIIHSLLHLGRSDADAETLTKCFPYLELSLPNMSSMDVATAMNDPRTIRTHLAYHSLPPSVDRVKPKIVHVSRNPKDFAVAYYHFIRSWSMVQEPENYTFQDFLQSLMNSKVNYTPVFDILLSYWQRRSESNVLFIKYEDLHKDLPTCIRRIAAFLQISSENDEKALSDDDVAKVAERAAFSRMKASKHANAGIERPEIFRGGGDAFIRKGIVGDWRNYFRDDDQISLQYDEWIGENLKGTGLTFDYD